MRVVYKTTDDKEFSTETEAKKHQASLDDQAALTKEVNEDLNAILIKLDKVNTTHDGYLPNLKSIIKQILEDGEEGTNSLLQIGDYYNSNC